MIISLRFAELLAQIPILHTHLSPTIAWLAYRTNAFSIPPLSTDRPTAQPFYSPVPVRATSYVVVSMLHGVRRSVT